MDVSSLWTTDYIMNLEFNKSEGEGEYLETFLTKKFLLVLSHLGCKAGCSKYALKIDNLWCILLYKCKNYLTATLQYFIPSHLFISHG